MMPEKSFKDLANEALDCTKEGLNRLVEIQELQEALTNLPKNSDYRQLVEEIIEKEKFAVSLIQQATVIERGMMQTQHDAIQRLINNL